MKPRRLWVQTKMLHSMHWEAQVWTNKAYFGGDARQHKHVLLWSMPVFGTWRMAEDAALAALELLKIKEGE